MGPPSASSPLTPALATPRSISRTPGTGSSSATGRGRSETPFQVKAEPIDPPVSLVRPWDNWLMIVTLSPDVPSAKSTTFLVTDEWGDSSLPTSGTKCYTLSIEEEKPRDAPRYVASCEFSITKQADEISSPKLDSLPQVPRFQEPVSRPPRDIVSPQKLRPSNDRAEHPQHDPCPISPWQTPTLGRESAEQKLPITTGVDGTSGLESLERGRPRLLLPSRPPHFLLSQV